MNPARLSRASALLLASLLLLLPTALSADSGAATSPAATPAATSIEKGLSRRLIDAFQVHPTEPSHWIFVLDDDADGVGQVFRIETSTYLAAGVANPSVTTTYVYNPSVQPTTWQEARDHIVQTYAHVPNAAALTVRQLDVSTP